MFRIAVLDDDPDNRALLSLWLEDYCDVTEFGRAADALRWLESGAACDLVLSDISMPEMDGWEFLHRLRHELMSDLPVIAVSAHTTQLVKAALAAGFEDYLPKPTDQENLLDTIRKCLEA
jgi:CheY-like chemotaxis protein